jgi:hypothetical protein
MGVVVFLIRNFFFVVIFKPLLVDLINHGEDGLESSGLESTGGEMCGKLLS